MRSSGAVLPPCRTVGEARRVPDAGHAKGAGKDDMGSMTDPWGVDARTVRLAEEVPQPLLRELLVYWHRKRAGRPMPTRHDIDPVEIPAMLPRLLLIDLGPDQVDPVFRLVGTGIVRDVGFEPRGLRLDAVGGAALRGVHADALDVAETGRPRLASIRSGAPARPAAHRLLLPLSTDGATVDTLLGGIVTDGRPGNGCLL